MKPKKVIEIHGLKKFYGKHRGVVKVDMEVYEGEVFGFLGPNGAGKSTTIRTMMDLIRPTAGMIRVNGMDPVRDGAKVRRSVGYLPSDFGVYKNMTVYSYLKTLLHMMDHSGSDRIEEISARLQLDLTKKVKDLSRGNRQKVGIVSAFMHTPQLVIMDEPTSGLDPLMQQEFYKLCLEEKKAGRTIFLSSHLLYEVEAICDRVAIIREGELIVTETMKNFKKKTGKVLRVQFKDKVDEKEFLDMKGVTEVHWEEDILSMSVAYNIDSVIKELARHSVKDMEFKETSLEHIFLHFYGVEGVSENGTKEEVEA